MISHRYATFFCSWDVEIYIDDSLVGQLTRTMQQVCRVGLLVTKAYTNRAIADELFDSAMQDKVLKKVAHCRICKYCNVGSSSIALWDL